MMPTLDDGTYRLPYHGYGEFEEVWITSSSGREMVRVLKMSNEYFLKAAADRAQVGSSAVVARRAMEEVMRKPFYDLSWETKQYLVRLLINECSLHKDRAEIVDGNP